MATLMLSCMFIGLLIHNIHCYNFGFNNSYTCHCRNDERCYTNGFCNNGCLKWWGGPSCQQENKALDSKSVSQSGTFHNLTNLYGPQLVVDGKSSTDVNINKCSDTGYSPWAWWSINLQQQYSIGYLKIFHRDGNPLAKLKGFSVHIDNELCYQHTGTSNPFAANLIDCGISITGRIVNISNIKPGNTTDHYIALCEVEIYVCSQGTYGPECNNVCHCSNNDECDVITGQCPNGCKIGWYGDSCNKFCHCSNNDKCDARTGQCPNGCQIGWYGDSCNKKCSTINKYGVGCQKRCDDRQCSGYSTCDHVTGECSNGCKPGYKGIDCLQECPSGNYGDRCNKKCNNRHCKRSQDCHHITGKCKDGCKPGYTDDDCSQSCSTINKYGVGCENRCDDRQCSGYSPCDPISGKCTHGCRQGYRGNDCSQDCLTGTYGAECSENCSERNCLGESSPCNHIDGRCEGGCKDGYVSIDCKQECTDGFYGTGCQKNCYNRKCLKNSYCDHESGTCVGGCAVGYSPTVLDCTQVCLTGTYGTECLKNCSERNCLGESSPCNNINGSCEGRCKDGYVSIDCTKDCDTGFYGAGCRKKCSDRKCNDNSKCNSKTGECFGCSPGFKSIDCSLECDKGFYGYNCSSNCSARFCQSEDDHCNNIDGACVACLDDFIGIDCTIIKKANTDTENESPIVATAVSISVVLIVIVVIVVVWIKRRQILGSELCTKSDDVDSLNAVKLQNRSRSEQGPIFENSVAIEEAVQNRIDQDESGALSGEATDHTECKNILPANSDFNLRELEEFVIKTSPRKGFEELYKALFDDFTSSYDVSHIAENRKKNRFKGYYPYDSTRVILRKLPGDPHSDYINANYLNGYDGKMFIGAQGTTAVTINDFVRMIWDTKCKKVVMVTREFEGGKNKCLRYWPEHETETFGEIKLTLKKENIRANYTKRHITMERAGTTHEFCHFHYISWPDHGVPDIQDMLDFQYSVNKYIPNSTKPVLVHCSAGVGRTGTYIAIDYCLKRYNDIGKVDVLKCVKDLREQRKGMVQTASQLQFIHEAVIEGIKRGDTAMNKDRFDSKYSENNVSYKMGNRTLKQQFAYLKSLKYNEGVAEKNKQIISDKTQLYRYSSYTCDNSILFEDLDNVPISDVWKAVYTAQIPVVIFILDSTYKDDVCPEVGSAGMYDDCIFTAKSENRINDELKTTSVSVSFVQEQEINVIILNFDKRSSMKPRTLYESIVEILVQLDTKSHNDFDPVAVFTSDTYYARIFCILMNILQRIRLDDEVEIFNVVRKIHTQFGLTIQSQEDYNTLHGVVSDFVEARSTYANLL